MIIFLKVTDSLPENFEEVYIKTDCSECPIVMAIFANGKFVPPCIIQCDHHYETDQKFSFIGTLDKEEVGLYTDRIVEWARKDS